ncbi:MAG: SixA phosphatase family protein [Pseudonocardiaceae bacterium]
MRRTLVILRHAKSGPPDGKPDVDRPLAERGMRDAPAVGRWLNEHVPKVDLVICSPAQRARQTWQVAAGEFDADPRVVHDVHLYAASARDLAEVVRELPAEAATVLLVGHNPGLEDLVLALSGEPCTLKTSSIAVLSGEGEWTDCAPGWAELTATTTPRG